MNKYLFTFIAVNEYNYRYSKIHVEFADSLEMVCLNFEKWMQKEKQKLVSYNVCLLQEPIFEKQF